jgi:uncharacterized protein YndB with AHSA1/START domain/quercetin dioxygenase-like cupin family protein
VAHTDTGGAEIAVPPATVFAALVDPEARAAWLPPTGMTGRFEYFDVRPGGGYRMVLSYDDPARIGKTEENNDVTEVRFLAVEPPRRIVEQVEFVSDDPAFAGTMTMTWTLEAVPTGTRVRIVASGVPDGISSADHATAFASTLANLDRHLRGVDAVADRARRRVPAIVVPNGQGELIPAAGVEHLFRLTAAQTGGRFGLEEFSLAPATAGPLPHVHFSHDEYFYVVAGELTVATADGETVLGVGDVAAAVRGSVHGYRNAHPESPVRALTLYTPAGYEQYFRDVHAATASGITVDDELLADLRARYDTESG